MVRTSVNILAVCTTVSSNIEERLEVFHGENTMLITSVRGILKKPFGQGRVNLHF